MLNPANMMSSGGNVKNHAPHGVIFCSDKKAFVGISHGVTPTLSSDLVARLQSMTKYGLWYEGDGGDIRHTEKIFGPKSKYTGGFDDYLTRSISGHPPEFLYGLFSNNPPDKIASYITGPGTILDRMIAMGQKISVLKSSTRPSSATVVSFLRSISNPAHKLDFYEMARTTPATLENAKNFINIGADEMWPDNWINYPNPAGKVAKKANDHRDIWLASKRSPDGVYVIGSGHLLTIKKLGGYAMIGGGAIK